ncbi:TonB-dependent receptor [Dinghuibacter silviterrae]|uniref:TonB-dependent receptor-like protein n=1 Tax=Dinghuibacter silviterrae TaxID=1539049 RepID=A0A4R8DFZ0_9BACT|nr:carboxypeptidase regulatory-like domain-containing protein [Dinghuibacter silviterrae]TDW96529.1 TonB-dependent receptor-like protein [Dinghuibacter silviterrae]
MSLKKLLLTILVALGLPTLLLAQETTSGVSGKVTNSKNEALGGATVTAIHVPSGSKYHALTQPDGAFHLSNMRVGGPYRIEISYVGYGTKTFTDLTLQLGSPLDLTVTLADASQTISEVTITGSRNKNALISPERMGTSTNFSLQQLSILPTTGRNVDDFTRLVPQAQPRKSTVDGSTLGVSFAGESNKYNQFTIDGANATDVFGLAASGTNGGQASLNPIPFDAIDQVQVILAPYDVTLSGFVGGGVNAVTRSGTNTLHGSVYGFNTNQSFVGKQAVTGNSYGNFKDWTYGARLGGAFIKNKLFFFVNYEGERKSNPVSYMPGSATSQIRTTALDSITSFLKNESAHPGWSYNPGAYNGFNTDKHSDAVFARIDWNIDEKNKLTIRHSLVKGYNFIFSDAASSAYFYNTGYRFNSTNNSTVVELNSNISNKVSNVLRGTMTITRDNRKTPGTLFPYVKVSDNGATYYFGTDVSSQANSLGQNTYTITDNLNLYAGKNTFTFGTDDEFYHSKNVFLQGIVGSYTYASLASFFADAGGSATAYPTAYSTVYSTDKSNPEPAAKVSAGQFSLYAQDAYQAAPNFKLTLGIRADAPTFFTKPADNTTFNSTSLATSNGVATNQVAKTAVVLSPRVGFNWDVKNDKQTQIRGGVGIFMGRTPFVWLSNQYSNTGIGTISGSLNAAQVVTDNVHFNPTSPYQPAPSGIPLVINVTDPHYKYPRSLRSNLAIDQRLPWGLVGTLEGIFTKTIQDISYQDLNLAPSQYTLVLGNTTRPFYGSRNNASYANVLELTNTKQGYGYSITGKIEKPFSHGWTASVAYSIGHSYATNNGTSSVALSNWRYAYNVNGLNNLSLGHSNYDPGSRVIAYVGKRFEYGKIFSTSLGLIYSGTSGQRFSYVYYGNINGDDGSTLSAPTKPSTAGGADLIQLPGDSTQFVAHGGLTATQQWTAFQQFENSTKYMRKHIGQNTAINGDIMPWENHFDLKIAESIAFYKEHTLTITLDIFNVGNLVSKTWGRAYYLSNQESQPLNVDHFTVSGNTVKPYYYYTPQYGLNAQTGKPWGYADYESRWSMLLGLRYSF